MINNKNCSVRVRFAPSPTGNLHIGGLRTALFNWLFARHYGGAYVMRIEDTDIERSRDEYTDSIMTAFKWAGIESDEPLVFQSQRFPLYKEYLDRLLDSGHAYRSDPSTEENGKSVIRFKVPRHEPVLVFDDLIYGTISFPTDQIDDFVIARADDTPLYNFVVVVDDIEMRISHIIRADEHIPNTPRQLLLYRALGATPPLFAHVSLICGPSGKPLSKRDASTSVLEYRDAGFLPDALCNYLVRLGWAHGDQEILSREELIKLFDLNGINKSGAMFDAEKLLWVNSVYMRAQSSEELLKIILSDVDPQFLIKCPLFDASNILNALNLYKERTSTLQQLTQQVIALNEEPYYKQVPPQVPCDVKTKVLLQDFMVRLSGLPFLTADEVKKVCAVVCSEHAVALPLLAKPLRFALTGLVDSPSIYTLVELLGYAVVARRCDVLIKNVLDEKNK